MKKDFTASGNSALAFISQESIEQAKTPKKTKKSKKAKPDPGQKEIRSKRVQLVIKPSMYDAIREKAHEEYISVNEAIVRAITNYLK